MMGQSAEPAPALRAVDVSKAYGTGDTTVHALRSCSIELQPATVSVVVGPSGSGKSTLLHVLSGLDTPSTGRVWLDGLPLSEQSERTRARWRARHIGFVLQRDNLIPSLSVEENVATPLILAGTSRSDALRQARATLELVDLSHRAKAWPGTISGGEAQRAAVARACAGKPRLIFSDEPTGALDSRSGRMVLDVLVRLSHQTGAAALLVTHDRAAVRVADAELLMEDGRLRRST
jgi:ABC-type lipoprotein export system ATPase subunit